MSVYTLNNKYFNWAVCINLYQLQRNSINKRRKILWMTCMNENLVKYTLLPIFVNQQLSRLSCIPDLYWPVFFLLSPSYFLSNLALITTGMLFHALITNLFGSLIQFVSLSSCCGLTQNSSTSFASYCGTLSPTITF